MPPQTAGPPDRFLSDQQTKRVAAVTARALDLRSYLSCKSTTDRPVAAPLTSGIHPSRSNSWARPDTALCRAHPKTTPRASEL